MVRIPRPAPKPPPEAASAAGRREFERQLEWADTYLAAAAGVDVDPDLRARAGELRREVATLLADAHRLRVL